MSSVTYMRIAHLLSTRYAASRWWLYTQTPKLARSMTNQEASVVATQATGRVHVPWSNLLIRMIRCLNSITYPVQLHIYACCFERWPSELITWYSMRTIGMFAYGLYILNHSSLWRRDQRLSTGGVEKPSNELVVRRLSEFERGNCFQGQIVFTLAWTKSKDWKIHKFWRKEPSADLSINRRTLPQWLKENQAMEKRP